MTRNNEIIILFLGMILIIVFKMVIFIAKFLFTYEKNYKKKIIQLLLNFQYSNAHYIIILD